MILQDIQQAIDEIMLKHEGLERVDYSYCPQAVEGYKHQIWMFPRKGYAGRKGWGVDRDELTTVGMLCRADDFVSVYSQAMTAEVINIQEKFSHKLADDFRNTPNNPQYKAV